MPSPETVYPPLASLLASPAALRTSAASFEAMASDDAFPLAVDRRFACWRIAAALRLAAIIMQSGEACTGGHLAALELEIRGK